MTPASGSSHGVAVVITPSDQEAHTPLAAPGAQAPPEPSLLQAELEGGASGYSLVTVTSDSGSVMLDRGSYRRLFLRHMLSLIPALALVVALAFVARSVPCELPLHQETGEDAADRCDAALHTGLTLDASMVGAVAWLAAWSLRSASWLVASYFAAFPDIGHAEIDPVATSLVSIFIRTACLELLRAFSLTVGYALFIAEATINPRVGNPAFEHPTVLTVEEPDSWVSTLRHHHARFALRPRDPRFSIAMWVSFGWAVAETIVGCVQILQQLSLYAPPLDEPEPATVAPVILAPAHTLSPKPLRNAPLWPTAAGAMAQKAGEGSPKSASSSRRDSLIGQARSPSRTRVAALEDDGAGARSPRRSSSPKLASPPAEDPSTQLQQARDELARITQREIPQYGATDGTPQGARSISPSRPGAQGDETRPLLSQGPAFETSALGRSSDQPYEDGAYGNEAAGRAPEEEQDEIDEEELEEALRKRQRDELQETLGVPLPDVPVTLCLLWRVDGVLFNLGASLIIAAALAHGQGRLHIRALDTPDDLPTGASTLRQREHDVPLLPELDTYIASLVSIFLVHSAVSSIWQLSVPRFGFALITYSSLLIGLTLVLIGLAQWGVLV